jgi:CBS domain containing-hemolysin-like protein
MSVPEMVAKFRAEQHPRVPVFRVHRDNVVGFVHAEDVLRVVLDKVDLSTLQPADIMHPPVVVPLTKKVDEMFDFFQANNARAAVVLNEFGGIEGLVSMKDVLTFIFGQISGDVQGQELYQERDENSYAVKGDMKLTDFNNLTNFGIEDPRMTTIGGVAFRHLDRLPKVGDSVNLEGILITVLEMDEHRIASVRVSCRPGVKEAAEEEETPEIEPETDAAADAEAAEADAQEGEAEVEERLPVTLDGAADSQDADRKQNPDDYRKEA